MDSRKRLLIVEDELLIAMMMEDFADAIGMDVAGVAGSVSEAIAIIEAGAVDVAIVDINLRNGERSDPVMAALDAAGIPLIVSSGSTESMSPGRVVLNKPYTLSGMETALEGVMKDVSPLAAGGVVPIR